MTKSCFLSGFYTFTYLQFFGVFMDPDFVPIRIRTQEKKSDPDPKLPNNKNRSHYGIGNIG